MAIIGARHGLDHIKTRFGRMMNYEGSSCPTERDIAHLKELAQCPDDRIRDVICLRRYGTKNLSKLATSISSVDGTISLVPTESRQHCRECWVNVMVKCHNVTTA